jgi:hypothetical protein
MQTPDQPTLRLGGRSDADRDLGSVARHNIEDSWQNVKRHMHEESRTTVVEHTRQEAPAGLSTEDS